MSIGAAAWLLGSCAAPSATLTLSIAGEDWQLDSSEALFDYDATADRLQLSIPSAGDAWGLSARFDLVTDLLDAPRAFEDDPTTLLGIGRLVEGRAISCSAAEGQVEAAPRGQGTIWLSIDAPLDCGDAGSGGISGDDSFMAGSIPVPAW